ncbi:MAG TPA: hypothetical protein VKE51_15675 [Vicinamibacterales bacterium]|nr:hypothetical protein [Vicinamibacterales bacterium]
MIAKVGLASFAALLATTVASPVVRGQAQHVRWDIIRLSTPATTVNPGGQASAMDNLGDTITLTGSGTFVAPAGRGGTSSAVTGGGLWTITTAAGTSSGAYEVTGLVRWEEAPGTFPATFDNIGAPADFRSGLAVLRIEYSDGSHGILVVSCHGAGTPNAVFEGVTASKDYVDFWNRVAPSGGPAGANANRTAFHLE